MARSSSLATGHWWTTHRLSHTSSVTLEAIPPTRTLHEVQDSLTVCPSRPFGSWQTSGKYGSQSPLGILKIKKKKASHHMKIESQCQILTLIPESPGSPWNTKDKKHYHEAIERRSSLNLVQAKSSCRLTSPETKTPTPKGRQSFSRGVCCLMCSRHLYLQNLVTTLA